MVRQEIDHIDADATATAIGEGRPQRLGAGRMAASGRSRQYQDLVGHATFTARSGRAVRLYSRLVEAEHHAAVGTLIKQRQAVKPDSFVLAGMDLDNHFCCARKPSCWTGDASRLKDLQRRLLATTYNR